MATEHAKGTDLYRITLESINLELMLIRIYVL